MTGLKNIQKVVVDDISIYSKDEESLEEAVHQLLLTPDKFVYAQDEVEFFGYNVGSLGVSIDPKKIEALSKFPMPTSLTELRSFMGLVNQLGEFSNKTSTKTAPLRSLLSSKSKFVWLPSHTQAFEEIKHEFSNPAKLKHYDPKLPTRLLTDASKLNGLGFMLMQQRQESWHMIQCGSRFLTPTESRYASIELELLAISWAMKKCRKYLLGRQNFDLIVDHRPLVSILDKNTLDQVENPRLQRMKESLNLYKFTTQWIKGKLHAIPDALSRAPVDQPCKADSSVEEDREFHFR